MSKHMFTLNQGKADFPIENTPLSIPVRIYFSMLAQADPLDCLNTVKSGHLLTQSQKNTHVLSLIMAIAYIGGREGMHMLLMKLSFMTCLLFSCMIFLTSNPISSISVYRYQNDNSSTFQITKPNNSFCLFHTKLLETLADLLSCVIRGVGHIFRAFNDEDLAEDCMCDS